MLLTPAFRNMDAALEEAARVSGASNIRTALRVTLPLMISPIMLVFALQLLRVFQSFEVEYLLGTPIDFYVYSTKIFALIRTDVPQYGEATDGKHHPSGHRIDYSAATLGSGTAPLHHYQRDFQAWPNRAWQVELRSVRRRRVPAGAPNDRPIAHAGARQFYDKNWIFVLGFTLDHWNSS